MSFHWYDSNPELAVAETVNVAVPCTTDVVLLGCVLIVGPGCVKEIAQPSQNAVAPTDVTVSLAADATPSIISTSLSNGCKIVAAFEPTAGLVCVVPAPEIRPSTVSPAALPDNAKLGLTEETPASANPPVPLTPGDAGYSPITRMSSAFGE